VGGAVTPTGRSGAGASSGHVVAVHAGAVHALSKVRRNTLELIAGVGVAGDVHAGATVQHRSRVRAHPARPNLRQVHLIGAELHDELVARGFAVSAGALGENVTTSGVDLLALPTATRLRLGAEAVVEVTGLRNPCRQLEGLQRGLMAAVLDRDADGGLVRRIGVMGVVLVGGQVRPGDPIAVELPPPPHRRLEPV